MSQPCNATARGAVRLHASVSSTLMHKYGLLLKQEFYFELPVLQVPVAVGKDEVVDFSLAIGDHPLVRSGTSLLMSLEDSGEYSIRWSGLYKCMDVGVSTYYLELGSGNGRVKWPTAFFEILQKVWLIMAALNQARLWVDEALVIDQWSSL